jgi:hypothetical protein
MKSIVAVVVLAASAPLAAAQQQAAKPHPADPTAPVPATRHESVLSGYRGYREEPLAPWREMNDEVARTGGHIGIVGGAGRTGSSHGSGTAKPVAPPAQSAPGSIKN